MTTPSYSMRHMSFHSRSSSPLRGVRSSFLANRYVDQHDAGLCGVQGAEFIMKLLQRNRSARNLILGHNALGDTGCVALFDYLRSEEGKKHKLVEISLNANNIGDAGLWAIARYLEGNKTLNALFLQNNILKGDPPIMLRFVLAVNRSNLQTLSLTCNKSLGESISATFLPNLTAPQLTELHLSVCLLGPSATPALASYLASSRSAGLQTLKLNGNPLGLPSVTQIINALERSNWSVNWVEMHACRLNSGSEAEGNNGWRRCEEQLRVKVLERNRYLGRRTVEDALFLLPHARAALLSHGRQSRYAYSRLPPELIIHILSFLAPNLSAAQYIRVCTYAASPSTLPSLDLSFPSLHNTPLILPSSWPSSGSQPPSRHIFKLDETRSSDFRAALLTPGFPSVTSPTIYQQRKSWLIEVGCNRFEPDKPGFGAEQAA